MDFFLGLDIGTSGVKALLVTTEGTLAASVVEEYPLYSPKPGWSEQDPEDLWQATIKAIRSVLAKQGIRGEQIKAVGLSGQMHSSVFLDASAKPIRRAILWNDTRTTEQCREIEDRVGRERLREITANPALEGFTAPKILWLRKHEPEHYGQMRWVVLPKDYIRYRLIDEMNMEISDAAGTLLLDVHQGQWSREILQALDLPAEAFPPLVGSHTIAGHITEKTAAETNLMKGTPVVGGGADNACGAVGSGVVQEGRAMISLGTSGVMLAHLSKPQRLREGTIHMFNSAVPEEYYMMGVILSAGLSFRWLRDVIAGPERLVAAATGKDPYEYMGTEASLAAPGSGGVLFLPYLTGERTPHGDANCRGTFFGLHSAVRRNELIRSVMEGIAFAFRDSLELLHQAGWSGRSARIIGGGGKSLLWQRIMASATGLTLETINVDEGPAFGAALLAGVGVGTYADLAEAADVFIRVTGTTEPDPQWSPVYEEYYSVYRDLYPALKNSFRQLAVITGR